jgi:hypothetical protein
MITKITFCAWEGDPAVLVYYDTGRMAAFVNYGTIWRDAHPADVATKAAVIDKDRFIASFPNVGMPNLT